jgi:hypothetical protein
MADNEDFDGGGDDNEPEEVDDNLEPEHEVSIGVCSCQ